MLNISHELLNNFTNTVNIYSYWKIVGRTSVLPDITQLAVNFCDENTIVLMSGNYGSFEEQIKTLSSKVLNPSRKSEE